MNTEQEPKKGWRHDIYRLSMLLVLAAVTIIIATVLSNTFGM